MLYRTLERVIENIKRRGLPTDDIESKIDIFFAAGKLTQEEYEKLITKLHE